MNANVLSQLIVKVPFISTSEAGEIEKLVLEVEDLPTKDNDQAMARWSFVISQLAWYTSQAGMALERKNNAREELANKLRSEAYNVPAGQKAPPGWAAESTVVSNPQHALIVEEITTLKYWHDYLCRIYSIAFAQKSLLEQLANNKRAGMRLDQVQE